MIFFTNRELRSQDTYFEDQNYVTVGKEAKHIIFFPVVEMLNGFEFKQRPDIYIALPAPTKV